MKVYHVKKLYKSVQVTHNNWNNNMSKTGKVGSTSIETLASVLRNDRQSNKPACVCVCVGQCGFVGSQVFLHLTSDDSKEKGESLLYRDMW